MSNENFDIESLQNRIAEVKKENEESSNFTRIFLECLLRRHDLSKILHEDHKFEDVPEIINAKLRNGELPSEEEISQMDIDTQDYLIKDCIWVCGMGAIAWYAENEKSYAGMEPNPFEEIIKMPDISVGHHSASYIVAVFAILHCGIPSQEMIAAITNNFDSSQEQLEKNNQYYSDLCYSVLKRYQEDLEYYDD